MEAKSETSVAITLTRDELKALIKEAVKEALTEMTAAQNGSLHKPCLTEAEFNALLHQTSDQYKNVWQSLA